MPKVNLFQTETLPKKTYPAEILCQALRCLYCHLLFCRAGPQVFLKDPSPHPALLIGHGLNLACSSASLLYSCAASEFSIMFGSATILLSTRRIPKFSKRNFLRAVISSNVLLIPAFLALFVSLGSFRRIFPILHPTVKQLLHCN